MLSFECKGGVFNSRKNTQINKTTRSTKLVVEKLLYLLTSLLHLTYYRVLFLRVLYQIYCGVYYSNY